ncbi:MAG: 30S ribosomal protein S20 [Spirochaetaceae bacterium]|nr:MAG: 30S ribosomal protein S20 [Spirochaetaceae bacterium]
MVKKDSAAKRHRQSEVSRVRNRSVRSHVRSSVKGLLKAVQDQDAALAKARFAEVTKLIDTAAGKGIYHPNTAARTKARLSKKVASVLSAS